MQRFALDKMLRWQRQAKRKPLLLRGARHVGKTWLMRALGQACYAQTAYIDCENNERVANLFAGDFDRARILEGLSFESGTPIEEGKTLIILDDIQDVPAALRTLRCFAEADTNHAIVAATSRLGPSSPADFSRLTESVEILDIYPLSFTEFLGAVGEHDLADLLRANDWRMLKVFHDRLITALKNYFFVGGLPEVVSYFAATADYRGVREIQKQMLQNYAADFAKCLPPSTASRVERVWYSIPRQLSKANKKFMYNVVEKGGRAKALTPAIQWLVESGLCLKIDRLQKGGSPPKVRRDPRAFKLYLLDTGLLGAMLDVDAKTLLEGNRIFTAYEGALTEQYICQQIVSETGLEPFYWASKNSANIVDFVVQDGGTFYPLEVQAHDNPKAKSLQAFLDRFGFSCGFCASLADYREEEMMLHLPLCAIGQLTAIKR